MVLTNRSGSHQMLMRQLHQLPIGGEEEENDPERKVSVTTEEEEEDDDGVDQEEQVEEHNPKEISRTQHNREAVEEEEDDDAAEEEEEEDLFGQIASANPDLLLPAAPMGGKPGSFGRDDWGEGATFVLLQAWGEKCTVLNKWHLRRQHWAELADTVTRRSGSVKSDIQCKNRVDTLKKKFKHERQKQVAGGASSKWPFYKILDRLINLANNSKLYNNVNNTTTTNNDNNNNTNDNNDDDRNVNINVGTGDTTTIRGALPCTVADNGVKCSSRMKKPRNLSGSSSEEEELVEQNGFWREEEEQVKRRKRRRDSSTSSSSSLSGAIARLGEIFERMEERKKQQLQELEKTRLQFTRDLEMHRMQLFMQTQMEFAKIKQTMNDLDM